MIPIPDYLPPFRVGKKQKRAVLDGRGYEVVIFNKGMELWAEEYCQWLNRRHAILELLK